MELDFSPYAVGGAAARPDSFTRLDPQFATGVYGLTQAANAAGIPLQITSAYRSPELQAQLYQSALERYGSEQAARRMVAPPGGSQHNYGTAVDFAINGSLIRDPDSPAAQFIRDNAAEYGLSVPMSWEPWQVEPAANAGRITGAPQARISTRNVPTSTQTTGVGMNDTTQQPTSGGELSRNQRMMLGFAALRDAGAALQGQNTNFFVDTMSGFQQQAQAEEDRAFRQAQFDESVRQFGIAQAGSADQRGLLADQERRLRAEHQLQILTQLSGFEEQARALDQTNAARRLAGQPPLPADPYVAAQIAVLEGMLSQSGYKPEPGAGAPAPGAGAPAPGAGAPAPGAGAPAPGAGVADVPAAYAVIDGSSSTPEDIAQATAFLQNLPEQARSIAGSDAIEAAVGRGQARVDAMRARSEAAAQDAEQVRARREQLQTEGQKVVDYLLAGINTETGEFIINPLMRTQPLRNRVRDYGSVDYTRFESSLNNIIETIAAATVGILADRGVSLGVNLTDTDMDIIRDIGTVMSVDNPLGTLEALRDFEEVMGIDLGLGLGGAAAGGGFFESGGLTFEEVK